MFGEYIDRTTKNPKEVAKNVKIPGLSHLAKNGHRKDNLEPVTLSYNKFTDFSVRKSQFHRVNKDWISINQAIKSVSLRGWSKRELCIQ